MIQIGCRYISFIEQKIDRSSFKHVLKSFFLGVEKNFFRRLLLISDEIIPNARFISINLIGHHHPI